MNNQIRQWTKDYISAVVEKQQVEDPAEPHSDQYQVELEADSNGHPPCKSVVIANYRSFVN